MSYARKILIVCGLAMMSATAIADDLNVELTPFAAYRFGGTFEIEDSDDTYKLEDSPSFGLIWNLRQKYNTQWEVLYSRQETEANYSAALPTDPLIDVEIQALQLGGTYQGDGEKVRTYLAATLGGTHIKTKGAGSSSDTFWSGSIGLGIQFQPKSRVGIRLEGRAYGTLVSSNSKIFCGSGPEGGVCAVTVDGKMLVQFEALLGVVFRF